MTAALNTNGSVRVRCPHCKRWRTPKNRKRPECLACEPPVSRRKYPCAKVGDFFGSREVFALLHPDYTREGSGCQRGRQRTMRFLIERDNGRETVLGWWCACGTFNGNAKEQLAECRCCGLAYAPQANTKERSMTTKDAAKRIGDIAFELWRANAATGVHGIHRCASLLDDIARSLAADSAAEPVPESALDPIPMLLWCPLCHERHIDDGEFAKNSHRDHACQKCGLTWRPAKVPTCGVAFLPGYKNEVSR